VPGSLPSGSGDLRNAQRSIKNSFDRQSGFGMGSAGRRKCLPQRFGNPGRKSGSQPHSPGKLDIFSATGSYFPLFSLVYKDNTILNKKSQVKYEKNKEK